MNSAVKASVSIRPLLAVLRAGDALGHLTLRAEADRAKAFQLGSSYEITLIVPLGTPDNRPPFQQWESSPDKSTSPVRDGRTQQKTRRRAVGDGYVASLCRPCRDKEELAAEPNAVCVCIICGESPLGGRGLSASARSVEKMKRGRSPKPCTPVAEMLWY